MENSKHIVILGGGIMGISALHFAKKLGYSALVLEARPVLGGRLQTEYIQDTTFELGANTVMYAGKAMEELFTDLHLLDDIQYATAISNTRLVKKKTQVLALPSSPSQFLRSPLLTGAEKWRIIKALFTKHSKPSPHTSLYEWVEAHFGANFAQYFVDAFVKGIYAEHARNLNLEATFPDLYSALQECKTPRAALRQFSKGRPKSKGIIGLKKGWKSLFDIAHNTYPEDIQTGCSDIQVQQMADGGWHIQYQKGETFSTIICKHLIITPKHHDILKLQLPFRLPEVPYTSLRVSHYTYPIRLEIPNAYGILFPEPEKKIIYGILFNDKLFPKTQKNVMTVFSPFENTQEEVKQEILKCFPGFSGIELRFHTVWEQAIPKPNEQLKQARNQLLELERQHAGLHFGHDAMGYIAVGQRIEFAKQIVQACKA